MPQVKVLPAYYAIPDQSITALCNLLINLLRERGFRPACRTAEKAQVKQAGQAPSGNRGAARQRVPPEVHRESLQFFACQPRKLDEEARSQETEAVKSYGGLRTFASLGPILREGRSQCIEPGQHLVNAVPLASHSSVTGDDNRGFSLFQRDLLILREGRSQCIEPGQDLLNAVPFASHSSVTGDVDRGPGLSQRDFLILREGRSQCIEPCKHLVPSSAFLTSTIS